jgi:hypothetical protein
MAAIVLLERIRVAELFTTGSVQMIEADFVATSPEFLATLRVHHYC